MPMPTDSGLPLVPLPLAHLPLGPGAAIGIIGGGQLGRMLAEAATRLGFDIVILEPEPDSPAGRIATHTIVGAYDDPAALEALAAAASVVTYEFENVPASAVAELISMGVDVAPGAKALGGRPGQVRREDLPERPGRGHRGLRRGQDRRRGGRRRLAQCRRAGADEDPPRRL